MQYAIKIINMSKSTKRRSFLARTMAALAGVGLLSTKATAQERVQEKFLHIVFFWFKNPNNTAAIDDFIEGVETYLQRIDVIQTYHIGKPAGTPREVVDNSYSVSFVLSFKSRKDQDTYQAHQAHKDYIAEYQHLWERVRVYATWSET